jgi:CheY-like chemotaxis protein
VTDATTESDRTESGGIERDDRETILVVEDEILVRLVIADYLRGCGYRVYEAASADEALVLLQRSDIAVDIVFSDVEMPGRMDGFGLARWLRQHRPETEVVLAGSPQKAADAAGGLCEDGPLPKPYHPQAVLDRIRRLLASRSPRGGAA